MKSRRIWTIGTTVAVVVTAAIVFTRPASTHNQYEVWAIDQSDSPGKAYGGTLYVWDGHELEKSARHAAPRWSAGRRGVGHLEWMMRPEGERIDFGGDVSAMCMARTGANPVRPHMIAVNPAQTHVIVSFVATGHVLFIDADSREAVECLRTSPGTGGLRQAHMATPSPDGTYVTVANQNGKLFERIATDYEHNLFYLDAAATIDLANCTTPAGLPLSGAAIAARQCTDLSRSPSRRAGSRS